ncbi:unnamed protein product [Arctogadus glacialis]
MKTLQRRWTTFLKAQLVCEDRPSGQRYNVLTDVFTLRRDPNDPATTQFHGLFTSQWEREELAAVCVFSLSDINQVMDGPFKELKKTCENWINPEPVPRPRPGQCLNSALRAEGLESSLKLPDKVLTFARDHPLMENSVTAALLLLRRGVTYTKLAVTLADAGPGALLHLGIQEVAPTPVFLPQYSMSTEALQRTPTDSAASEECVSYCQPAQLEVRMNLDTYCLKDYVLKIQVKAMERSGPWWQFSIAVQTVFRTGSTPRVRRGPRALWVPGRCGMASG